MFRWSPSRRNLFQIWKYLDLEFWVWVCWYLFIAHYLVLEACSQALISEFHNYPPFVLVFLKFLEAGLFWQRFETVISCTAIIFVFFKRLCMRGLRFIVLSFYSPCDTDWPTSPFLSVPDPLTTIIPVAVKPPMIVQRFWACVRQD